MTYPRAVAITGAARGIGLATAHAFAAEGWTVAIGDLDADLARAAAEEVAAAGVPTVGLPLDVTDDASFRAFLEGSADALGPLGVLVNNAGIMPTGELDSEAEEITQRIVDINLKAVIRGTRLGLALLPADGTIVSLASQIAILPAPALATYGATKTGVLAFNAAMRRERAGRGPHLMTVLPGVVRTELSAGAHFPRLVEPLVAVDPEDVAAAIVRGVRRRKHVVHVPLPVGIGNTLMFALPYALRRPIEKAVGIDRAFVAADRASREKYHERLRRQL